jgi:hypothetical protein
MRDWITQHVWQLTGLSALLVAVGLVVSTILVVRMPADYFVRDPAGFDSRRTAKRVVRRVVKNGLAILLALFGAVLSLPLVPGPGLLLLLIALSLADFPGKRRLELRIIKNPLVLRPANTLRALCRHPPLQLPADSVQPAHRVRTRS